MQPEVSRSACEIGEIFCPSTTLSLHSPNHYYAGVLLPPYCHCRYERVVGHLCANFLLGTGSSVLSQGAPQEGAESVQCALGGHPLVCVLQKTLNQHVPYQWQDHYDRVLKVCDDWPIATWLEEWAEFHPRCQGRGRQPSNGADKAQVQEPCRDLE